MPAIPAVPGIGGDASMNFLQPQFSGLGGGASPTGSPAVPNILTTAPASALNSNASITLAPAKPAGVPLQMGQPAVPSLAAVPKVSYTDLVNRNGTIFNSRTGVGYPSPTALAGDLGLQANQIQWGQIRKEALASAPSATPDLSSIASPSNSQQTASGTTINANTGGVIGGAPDITPAPLPYASPYDSAEYKSAIDAVTKSQNLSPEEVSAQDAINKLQESLKTAFLNTEGQAIPLEFITGQKTTLEKRAAALEEPLQKQLALLQAKRQGSLDASKFALSEMDKKIEATKPTSVSPGSALIDPITGRTISKVAPTNKYAVTSDAFGNPIVYDTTTGKITSGGAGGGAFGNTTGKTGSGENNLSFEQYGLLANTNYDPSNQTDSLAQLYLDKYIKSGDVPTASSLGRAIKPGALAAVDQRARDLYFQATGQPMPNPEIIKGYQKIINSNNNFANNLKIQEGTVRANFGLNLENLKANDLNTSGVNSINTFLDNIKQFWLGNPEAAQYALQNATIQNEIGSLLAVRNATGTTVHDKLEAAGLVPKGASLDQQKAILKTLMTEAENAKASIAGASTDLYKTIDPLLQDPNNPLRAQGNPKGGGNNDPLGLGFNQGSGGTPTATMRTDRNNNPTAMTTDVAKDLGLKLGIDYTVGDKFPGNSNLHTAKLLGDPIAITIKGLDQGGFYTSGGNPRWTHTAITQAQWNKLSYNQKANVVKQMYQKEGGKTLATLFKNYA